MDRATSYSLIVVLFAVAFHLCEGGVVAGRNREGASLHFLGKFVSPTGRSVDAAPQQISYYFVSQNAAGWATAESDCKAFLGDTASLVAIETEEELEAINDFLGSSDDTISEVWLGGLYDVGSSSFVWNNDVPVGEWASWDVGQPAVSVSISRISGNVVRGIKFRSEFNTKSLRYMCELSV